MEEFVIELSPEEELIRSLIEPLLDSEGFELVRIRLKKAQAKSWLGIFVDTRGHKNGIKIENLEDISRLLSDVLDASFENEEVIKGHYELEVSSPGLDRPLSKPTHFQDAVKEKIRLRLKNKDAQGSKTVLGILETSNEDGLMIEPENNRNEKLCVPWQEIQEANIVFDFLKAPKKKPSGK